MTAQASSPPVAPVPWRVTERRDGGRSTVQVARTAFAAYELAALEGPDGSRLHFSDVDVVQIDG